MMPLELALNPALTAPKLVQSFSKHFAENTECCTDEFEIVRDPFPCLILRDVVDNGKDTLPAIEKILRRCQFVPKKNDLYSFKQTCDFNKATKPVMTSLRNFFLKDVLPWIKRATKIPLEEDNLHICSSLYQTHDVLLCHDDELEGRRVAFVWYLVPESWSDEDGGHLDVFSSDPKCAPEAVVRSFLPRRNSLLLFEVSPRSWHQVREVLSSSSSRLSVNGWFCGPSLPRNARDLRTPAPTFLSPVEVEEQLLYSWVRRQYLAHAIQSQIHDNMLEDSQVLLTDFLFEEKYQLLRAALRGSTMPWTHSAVPFARCVDLPGSDLPDPVRALLRLLGSDAMMVVLADMTGLSLHPAARRMEDEEDEDEEDEKEEEEEVEGPSAKKARAEESDSPKPKIPGTCFGEVRRWRQGCYTLLSDSELQQAALVASLFIDCEAWTEEAGGFHSYIAKNEDDELLCVEPTANALALVYRDEETLQFVKYVTSAVDKLNDFHAFYDFSFLYLEPKENE